MYICVCKVVTDKQIRQAAAEGATTLRELRERFEIGTNCGKCARDARRVLREAMLPIAVMQAASEPVFSGARG
jgi:bacterioferritin-associated ferredoxin